MAGERDLPVVAFTDHGAWEAWLEEHHATTPGIWLKIAKKGRGIQTVSYSEALDVALCYGWIDGQRGALDEDYWLQRFTPRKSKSKWSKINRERATKLIAAGKMKPAGQREIAAAKADGRWDAAYEGQKDATVPEDLARELEKNEAALQFFAKLTSANRYAILYRIQDAKRPETRARRIAQFVAMLADGKTIHPQR